jgi:hypothetical protein
MDYDSDQEQIRQSRRDAEQIQRDRQEQQERDDSEIRRWNREHDQNPY